MAHQSNAHAHSIDLNMGNTEAKGKMSVGPKTSVSFTLNGAPVEVQGVSPSLTLNAWLRMQPGLTGTKKMCGEGGCGCCVVAVTLQSPVTKQDTTFAINSVRHTTDHSVNHLCMCVRFFVPVFVSSVIS